MSLDEFIEKNRAELCRLIDRSLNHVPRQASCDCPKSGTDHDHDEPQEHDDEDLRQWILNDEGLYSWATSEGVRE
jgi:hypothetical protein